MATNGVNGITNGAAPKIPTVKLSGKGAEMPLVGFGLWKVANATCADTVYNAIKTGYRLFDSACDYGNEKEAGEGLARAIQDGLVTREDVFITSKLWNTYHAKEHVEELCRKQLADWQLDYFDLFLIHFPVALKYVDPAVRYPPGWEYDAKSGVVEERSPIFETYQAMEKLVPLGLTKEIGVSNFSGALLLDILRYCTIRPAALQVELHPYLTQDRLIELCEQEGIQVTGYSSFGPASFVELDWEKAKNAMPLFDHPVVNKVADRAGKTPAQVLLRWATQRGIAVVPKSNSQARLLQNLDVCGFDLEDAEIKEITKLNIDLRFNNPVDYLGKLAIFS